MSAELDNPGGADVDRGEATPSSPPATSLAAGPRVVVVAARNEAARIGETLRALAEAMPDAVLWVGDDASGDVTAEVARIHGARVVSRDRPLGKGGNATIAAEAALAELGDGATLPAGSDPAGGATFLLCDADLGSSAAELLALIEAVEAGEADLTVAVFATRVGGGIGLALGFARWAIRRRCGFSAGSPISGQRAMPARVLRDVLPFAHGFGMEIGITIDAVRAGHRVEEIELPLSHRATGRSLRGFAHRGRQLVDFFRVYIAKRHPRRPGARSELP